MGLRFEVWTLPSAASFEKKFDVPEVLAGSAGVRELSSYTNERLSVPSSWEDIDSVASETVSSWIRVYDGTTLIDEFRAMRVSKLAKRPSVRQISGPQRNGMVEWCGIYPFSETQPDWIFGGENLLTNPSFEDNTAQPLIYHLWTDATGGTFTLSDGTDTTSPIDYDGNPGPGNTGGRLTIENALQDEITAITDVFVGGSGVESDPWVIEFNDPKLGVTLSVDGSSLTGGSATLTREQAGELTPTGWEPNQHVLEGVSDQPFGNPNTFEVSDEQASDGSFSVKIDQPEGFPPSGFAGVQQRVRVNSGGTYQAAGDFYPTDGDDTFYLTIRTLDNEHIDSSTGGITPGTLTPDQWNTESIVDVTIPDHVSEIIFRYAQGGTGDADNDPAPWYADNAIFTEGFAASTYTKILRLLIEAAQARGTFGFIELDATDGADSNGTTLSAISFTAYTGDNAHLGHVVNDGKSMGYHWRIVPASEANVITPAAGTTHVLQVFFDSEGEIEDLTASAGGPSVTTGGQLEDAETITRTPDFTTIELLGTGSLTLEDTDATLEANMGRIERVKDAEHLADTSSLQQLADGLFADQASNQIAAKAVVLSTDQNRPGIDYTEGSKIWWQFPGILDKEARVVRRFGWTHGTVTRYDVQGSTVYTDESALARAVDHLLNQLKRRRRGGKGLPASALRSSLQTRGQSIHVTASESIPNDTVTAVTFETVIGPTTHGFEDTRTSIPTPTLTAPFSAVSQVTVRVTWPDVADNGWMGDGVSATLKLNGTTIDRWVADDPALFPIAPLQADSVKLPVATDDTLTLELYQASGQARDATVEVSWGLEDQTSTKRTPSTVLVQARAWEDGTTEPSTWDVEATTDTILGNMYATLIVGDLSDDGNRRADWVGWGPNGSAPVQGESGSVTDFDEAAHTVGQSPAGWTQIVGTDRITVQSLASSNTAGGQAAVSDNWVSGTNDRGVILWTDASAGDLSLGALEVTAVLQSGKNDRNPPSVGIVNLSDEGWQVQPGTQSNNLVLRSRVDGVLDSAASTFNTDTWYRVRLRVTPGG